MSDPIVHMDYPNEHSFKGGRPLMAPKPAYTKFTGEMLEAFKLLTDAMYKKGGDNLVDYGKFHQTYKQGADELRKTADLNATDFDVGVSDGISKKMDAITKPVAVGKLEQPMKDIIDICSKYLAQNAENNKDKGEAFKYIVKKMREQPGDTLCQKGKIKMSMGQGANDLDAAKGLDTDHDDPKLTQEIFTALQKISKDHPSELKGEMPETLEKVSKYLSQKVVDDNERGPAFDKMIEILNKHGGDDFMPSTPFAKKAHDAAYILKNAPGLTSVNPDPASSAKYQAVLHKIVDPETPNHMLNEMPDVIKKSGDYLSGLDRDRGKAQEILLAMMNKDKGKVAAKRNNQAMTYGEGASEFATTPIMAPLLPIHDVQKEIRGNLDKDVASSTPADLKGAMKTLTRDAGGDLSQDLGITSGIAGERYPRNLVAAAADANGDKQLFKVGGYGMTYAEAGETLRNAGTLEKSDDPKSVALSNEVAQKLGDALKDKVAPVTAAKLQSTVVMASQHLAKIGKEMNDALTFLLDQMNTKAEEPMTKIQGIPHTYGDCVKKIIRAPTLQNDQVDKGVYETVRSKLKDLIKEHPPPPELEAKMPVIIDDVAKFLAKPLPESEEEQKKLLAELQLLRESNVYCVDGQYVMTGPGAVGPGGVGGGPGGYGAGPGGYGAGAGGVGAGAGGYGAGAGGYGAGAGGVGAGPGGAGAGPGGYGAGAGGVGAGAGGYGAGAGGVGAGPGGYGAGPGGVGAGPGGVGAGPGGVGAGAGGYGAGAGGVGAGPGGYGAGPGGVGAGPGGVGAGAGGVGAGAGGVGAGAGGVGAGAGGVGAGAGGVGAGPGGVGAGPGGVGAGPGGVGAGPGGVGAGPGGVGAGPGGVGAGPGGFGAGAGGAGAGAGGVGAGAGGVGAGPGGFGAGAGGAGAGAGGVGAGAGGAGAGAGAGGAGAGAGAGGAGTGAGGAGAGADGFGPGWAKVGAGGAGAGGLGADGTGAGGAGAGGLGAGAGGVGAGGVGAGGVGAGGVGAGGVGAGGVGAGGVGAGGVGAGGVGAGGVGAGGVGAGGVGAGGVGAGGVGAGGVGAGGVGAGGVGAGGVGAGGVGAGGVGAGGVGAGGVGAGGVGAGGVGPGGIGAGGVGAGGVGPGGVGPGGVGAGGVGAGGAWGARGGPGGPGGADGAGGGAAGAGGAGKYGAGVGADDGPEAQRARRLSEIRRRLASGERGGVQDKEHEDAKKILINLMTKKGEESFYKQGPIGLSHKAAADVLVAEPEDVDKNIREAADTDKLARKFEKKLGGIVEGKTPDHMHDAMTDVIIESARPLAEHIIARAYKSSVQDALIDAMQRRDNELLFAQDGDTETFFYAAQRLKKSPSLQTKDAKPKLAREIVKSLEDCIKCRPLPRKLAGTMKDNIKHAGDYLSEHITEPDPEIDALVDLLSEMEDAGDKPLIEGDIPKSHKDAAAYLKSLVSFEDKIGKVDKNLQGKIESGMKKLMEDVPIVGYTPAIRTKVIEQQAGLLTAYLLLQGQKTEALNTLVDFLDQDPDAMILRHGSARKSFFDAARLLHGKNPDQIQNVKSPDPIVARKLQIRLNNVMAENASKPFMDDHFHMPII